LVIAAARAHAVPAGSALAVDRDRFAAEITARLEALGGVEIRRGEVVEIPAGDVVLATGPLTSPALAERIAALLGEGYLYFYDAIAPIVDGETLDHSRLFWGSRYGKGEGDDYLNVPLDREGYDRFLAALLAAEVLPLHDFERELFFEGCLPIEELARRGPETLRFGPMKPVGLRGPDGRRPWAVVQLRAETLEKRHFNLVGFQSRMKWGEQQRVFALLPGFESAEFVRFGQIHRNTFVNSPRGLDERYRLRAEPRVRLAGQITGVEGYLESAATGLSVALDLVRERRGARLEPAPPETALGALVRHLTASDPDRFQPANVHYGLFPRLEPEPPRKARRAAYAARAAEALAAWRQRCDL
ncbi:MAG TPA: methylenetetrahydrofolate--tRNA-(uracil(54)-C(5))-methyltransferase (FADH(2)-oxidizing) TrmFO, partial [Thermoanaerobaculia bacterium]|nr:methylenetetrahydrofolate--tRNA-(uracil(54)-C(5))-methyltransferase (FADH(2)-oxidizing) TrmFO [Thermoanaerobaculia bacterium]